MTMMCPEIATPKACDATKHMPKTMRMRSLRSGGISRADIAMNTPVRPGMASTGEKTMAKVKRVTRPVIIPWIVYRPVPGDSGREKKLRTSRPESSQNLFHHFTSYDHVSSAQ